MDSTLIVIDGHDAEGTDDDNVKGTSSRRLLPSKQRLDIYWWSSEKQETVAGRDRVLNDKYLTTFFIIRNISVTDH